MDNNLLTRVFPLIGSGEVQSGRVPLGVLFVHFLQLSQLIQLRSDLIADRPFLLRFRFSARLVVFRWVLFLQEVRDMNFMSFAPPNLCCISYEKHTMASNKFMALVHRQIQLQCKPVNWQNYFYAPRYFNHIIQVDLNGRQNLYTKLEGMFKC